jgi:hypothetical protein
MLIDADTSHLPSVTIVMLMTIDHRAGSVR